jgi:hypothetical protein
MEQIQVVVPKTHYSFFPPMIEENDFNCFCYLPLIFCLHQNKVKNQDVCRLCCTCLWCLEDPNAKTHCFCCIENPNTCKTCNLGCGIGPIGYGRDRCYPFCCEVNVNKCGIDDFCFCLLCLSK